MMNRQWVNALRISALAALLAGAATSASAQVFQVGRDESRSAVGIHFGAFFPDGRDRRHADDVLLANLRDSTPFDGVDDSLFFDVGDFRGFTFGGEYIYRFSPFLEAAGGIGYYSRSVPSIYNDLVDANDNEIGQDLKLRIVPITATVRFLPLGDDSPIEPYVGGGVGFFLWKYREVGEFVDLDTFDIFEGDFEASGTAVGPVVLGGVRFPVADTVSAGGELRWQRALGDTTPAESNLLGDKIDLGGWSAAFTLHFRF